MPIYRYECLACRRQTEELLSLGQELFSCPECGGELKKQIAPCVLKMAKYALPAQDDMRAKHRAWLEKDETKARFKSGELDFAEPGEEVGDNEDGPEASSSFLSRLESGCRV